MKLQPLKNLKLIAKPILVGSIIGAIFLTYMVFIGIPKTRAAGYYELAVQQLGLGARVKAEEYFKKSIESYPEEYVENAYLMFRLQIN